MDRWGEIKVERERNKTSRHGERRRSAIFTPVPRRSKPISDSKKKKRFMRKGFNVFSPVKIKEREREKKKKGGTVLFMSSGTSESRLEP